MRKDELRCVNCERLLGKGEVVHFETKCPRCKIIVIITKQEVQQQHHVCKRKQAH